MSFSTSESSHNDLGELGFGVPWGHTRSFANLLSRPDQLGPHGHGWLASVTLLVNHRPVRRCRYAYYEGVHAGGGTGDLASATIEGWDPGLDRWFNLRQPAYRYTGQGDPDGPAHELNMAFNAAGSRRLTRQGLNFATASNSALLKFSSHKFAYNSARRVIEELVRGGKPTSRSPPNTTPCSLRSPKPPACPPRQPRPIRHLIISLDPRSPSVTLPRMTPSRRSYARARHAASAGVALVTLLGMMAVADPCTATPNGDQQAPPRPEPTHAHHKLARVDIYEIAESLPEITRAELAVVTSNPVEHPRATLLVCPGQNGDGAHFLNDGGWVEFAERHQLAVAALRFESPDELLRHDRGYFRADRGSGDLLIAGLEALGYPADRILVYGFSGGAHFANSLAQHQPGRVIAAAAFSARSWHRAEAFDEADLPRLLIGCGSADSTRLGPSMAHFQAGRLAGHRWLWVRVAGHGHARHRGFEELARDFFAAVLNQNLADDNGHDSRPAPVWVDVSRRDASTADDIRLLSTPTQLTGWLPCTTLLPAWSRLHSP